jgi:hypothetical protein
VNKENDYVMPAETIHYGSTSQRPLGTVLAARFGDKGGNANVGVWTDTADRLQLARLDLDTSEIAFHAFSLLPFRCSPSHATQVASAARYQCCDDPTRDLNRAS